ncbi:MAG: hypothetical protein CMJ33_05305 [Phycisphaerae bacterium]|nr:hypothetical protein [Phycisphaerae bacterium]HAW96349.1 hypothetical protein [Phycisphaerales bacterium]
MIGLMFLWGHLCGSGLHSDPSAAASVPLQIIDDRPHVVIGGHLVIPIRPDPERTRRALPEDVLLEKDDGGSCRASVVWLASGPSSGTRDWTSSTFAVRVIPAPVSKSERESAVGALVCDLQDEYQGSFRMDESIIRPRWISPAPPLFGDPLNPRVGPAWPMLDDPANWWRWELLAERAGARPPEVIGGTHARMLARNLGELWRAGLHRLRRESPGTAEELVDLLIARCVSEDGQSIAAWITDPSELRAILMLVLDLDRPDRLAVRSLLSYLDARFPLIIWPVTGSGDRVRFAIANPTDGEQVVRVQWVEGDPIPSGALVPPRSILDVEVDRPRRPDSTLPFQTDSRQSNDTLVISCGDFERRLMFDGKLIVARPPGVRFGPFLAPITLEEAWSDRREVSRGPSETAAILRKYRDHWEIFLECLHDPTHEPDADRVELYFGPFDVPVRVVTLSSDGSLEFTPGGGRLRGVEAVVRRFPDRWRATLKLDPSLLRLSGHPDFPDSIQIGIRRLSGDQVLSIAGGALPTWDAAPPIFLVDLGEWGDIQPPGR